MCIVHESVADGIGDCGVGESLVPTLRRQLRGDDGGGAVVAVLEDLEEIAPLDVLHGADEKVVEHEDVEAREALEFVPIGTVAACDGEVLHEARNRRRTGSAVYLSPVKRILAAPIVSILAIAGCGGAIDPHDAAVRDSSSDATDSGATEAGAWTSCSGPEGYRICRGSNRCPDLPCCLDPEPPSETNYAATVCYDDSLFDYIVAHSNKDLWGCVSCEGVCANLRYAGPAVPGSLDCVPYEIGVLYADGGAADRLRYADLGLWRNEPIPANAGACPSVSGFKLCGPGCGTCSGPSERCMGRAPLHPTGVCVSTAARACNANLASTGCYSTESCFTFTVELEAQAVADQYGRCVDAATCSGLAASIPGGGRCK